MIDCIRCNNAVLTPDGNLRCILDFSLTRNMCSEMDYGSAKLYKLEVIPVIKLKKPRKTTRK